MSLREITAGIKILENLFTDNNNCFYETNIKILQHFFQVKNIDYEILLPDKDTPDLYCLKYWDKEENTGLYYIKITKLAIDNEE